MIQRWRVLCSHYSASLRRTPTRSVPCARQMRAKVIADGFALGLGPGPRRGARARRGQAGQGVDGPLQVRDAGPGVAAR
jgi:hypothetical protein